MANLRNWILQSESWQKFKQFRLSEETMAHYDFYSRYDDFYISLVGKLDDILISDEINENEVLAVAKGLEIYGLKETKDNFITISGFSSLLYASSLYYLANRSSIASILANFLLETENLDGINEFLVYFLSRKVNTSENDLVLYLKKFIYQGDNNMLSCLHTLLERMLTSAGPMNFLSIKISLALMKKFSSDNIWLDLAPLQESSELWRKYIISLINKKMWNFFPSQREALSKGLLTDNKTMSLQMPTSAGKTAICEMLIVSEFIKNTQIKILFLVPFRSLASELKNGMCKRIKKLGIRCKVVYGSNEPTRQDTDDIQNVNLLVATPEKLIAYENLIPNMYDQYSIVICDEGHLIGDESRGLSYELLLSKLKKNESIRFIFLSAILPNIKEIHSWLSKKDNTTNIIKSVYRPTNISYGFLEYANDRSWKIRILSANNIYYLNKFITESDIFYINPLTNRKNTYTLNRFVRKSAIIGMKSLVAGSVAIFCAKRPEVDNVVNASLEIIQLLHLEKPISYANTDEIRNLETYLKIVVGSSYTLTIAAQNGILFHHGHLPQFLRELVEDYLRKQWVRYFVCTNTIAEGVNFPIKTLVVNSCRRHDGKLIRPIKIRDLKNLFGRTGRAGQETEGIVITINEKEFNVVEKVINDQTEAAFSYLLRIIHSLEYFLSNNRINFTNEWLENQDIISELIDKIDVSIISMLPNTIMEESIENSVNEFAQESLTYKMVNENEKNIFKSLFSYRSQRIKKFVSEGKLTELKASNVGICRYEKMVALIDFDDIFWTDENVTIDAILEKFLDFSTRFYGEDYFQYRNILNNWLMGKWYHQLDPQKSVSEIFDIFTDKIDSKFIFLSQSIISTVTSYLSTKGIKVISDIENFTHFIEHGVSHAIQIHLYELGFTGRLENYSLYNILQNIIDFSYINNDRLKNTIIANRKYIESLLEEQSIPIISKRKLLENIDFLDNYNEFSK